MENQEPQHLQKLLQKALQNKDREKIHEIIDNENFDVNWRDICHDLQTTLMKLCYLDIPVDNLLCILDVFFERDPDVNLQDSLGRTAVMHACIAGKSDIAEYLICDPATRIEIFDFDGNSVLVHAIKNKDMAIVKRILDHPTGHALLEICNSNGQRPVDVAQRTGVKKLTKLVESYQKKYVDLQFDKYRKSRTLFLPPAFSPQSEKSGTYNGSTSKKNSMNLHSPIRDIEKHSTISTFIDDDTPRLYLTSPMMRRRKNKKLDSANDMTLPAIGCCNDAEKNNYISPRSKPNSKQQKQRRNSISLPDLRETPCALVASGHNTPSSVYDYSDDSDFSDDAIEDLTHISKDQKPTSRSKMRRSASEKELAFPTINHDSTSSNVKRSFTEGNVYSHNDEKVNRLKLLQRSVLS